MTNREVLFRMSNTMLAQFLCSEDFTVVKRSWTQSSTGVETWLVWEATQTFIDKWLNNSVAYNEYSDCPVKEGDYVYFPKYTLGDLDGEVAKRRVERIDTVIVLESTNGGTQVTLIPDLYDKEWFTDPQKAKDRVQQKLKEIKQDLNKSQLVYDGGRTCVKCGNHVFVKREKGPHVGLYCSKCGYFVKWLNKQEKQFDEDEGVVKQDKDIPVVGVDDLPWD